MRWAVAQRRQHLFQRQIVVSHHVGQFIQQYQIQAIVGEHSAPVMPDIETGGGIAVAILRIPGKAGGHHLELDAVRLQQITLTVRPGTFDELHHAGFFTVSNRAGDGTEGGGGFAFAVTGKYHDQPAFLLGGGDPRIDFVFYPLLALAVALIAHWEIPGLRPGWASKVIPVLRRLSSPISHK